MDRSATAHNADGMGLAADFLKVETLWASLPAGDSTSGHRLLLMKDEDSFILEAIHDLRRTGQDDQAPPVRQGCSP
jgi:hypothetical protein